MAAPKTRLAGEDTCRCRTNDRFEFYKNKTGGSWDVFLIERTQTGLHTFQGSQPCGLSCWASVPWVIELRPTETARTKMVLVRSCWGPVQSLEYWTCSNKFVKQLFIWNCRKVVENFSKPSWVQNLRWWWFIIIGNKLSNKIMSTAKNTVLQVVPVKIQHHHH